jgi:glycosyltransferase involved in cell wall biosynthesis
MECSSGGKSKIGLSVILPAFNEEAAIGQTLESLRNSLLSMFDENNFEIILVDDGSTDRTAENAFAVSGVQVIRRPKNLGYGAAIKAGVRHAKFDWIFLMDADGQHTPEFINDFYQSIEEGYDMAIGARQKESHTLWHREPGKQLLKLVANFLSDEKIPDLNSGMRIFNKRIFTKYEPLYPNGFSITTTMTLAFIGDGYAVKFIPITTLSRVGRKSNVKIIRDGLNVMILILRTISLFNPLRIFLPAGSLLTIVGVAYSINNIILYSRPSRTAIILIIVGVLIFFFGVLADQIALLRKQRDNNRLG